MEKNTIVLGTYGENWSRAHSACVIELQQKFGVGCIEIACHTQIDMARSLLATSALQMGADVAFFLDHDIVFDPADVLTLADAARDTQGIVGAPYAMRRMGAGVEGGVAGSSKEIVYFEGGGVYPAAQMGMGFTAIHRSVFERLDALPEMAMRRTRDGECRPYFEKIVVDGYWMHEDSSFLIRAEREGIPMFLDTRIRVFHRGTHDFGIEDAMPSRAERLPTIRGKNRQ